MMEKVHETASTVEAEGGVVFVDGPDGVAIALTPEAAIETSDKLLDQGVTAQGQKVEARHAAAQKKARDERRD